MSSKSAARAVRQRVRQKRRGDRGEQAGGACRDLEPPPPAAAAAAAAGRLSPPRLSPRSARDIADDMECTNAPGAAVSLSRFPAGAAGVRPARLTHPRRRPRPRARPRAPGARLRRRARARQERGERRMASALVSACGRMGASTIAGPPQTAAMATASCRSPGGPAAATPPARPARPSRSRPPPRRPPTRRRPPRRTPPPPPSPRERRRRARESQRGARDGQERAPAGTRGR